MKKFLLKTIDPENDIDFLNSTSIYFYFTNDSLGKDGYDSGWCDMSTGQRLVGKNDSVVFITDDIESELLLKIRYKDIIDL